MKTSQRNNKKMKELRKIRASKKSMSAKILTIFVVAVVALLSLGWKLSDIVRNDGDTYTQKILDQQDYDSTILRFRRGDIIDRNGTVLAASERVYNLIIDVKVILSDEERYKDTTIDALVTCFGYDRGALEEVFATKSGSNYVSYEKQLPYEQMQAFVDLKNETNKANNKAKIEKQIHGVWFEEEFKRKYPYNTLACHLIGFSNSNGTEANTGGLEQEYNDILTGVNGREYGYLNTDSILERVTKPAQNGNSIMTTIDVNIQNIVEKHINVVLESYGCENIAVIAMDPANGEVLAMASNRTFDLNNPRDLSSYVSAEQLEAMVMEQASADVSAEQLEVMRQEKVSAQLYNMWRNYCINDDFEPGSTTKIFTIAAALEEGVINGSESYLCDGYEEVGGWKIKCSNTYGHGTVNVTQALMFSCNDALMQIANQIGKTRFSNYQKIFGFGDKTGIDLPTETERAGILQSLNTMVDADLATNSFGQNYTVTMVQVAAGYASVINGGSYYEPQIVKKILDENGSLVRSIEPNLVRETVGKSTSDFIKNALFQTVEEGTGSLAHIDGYDIAGKTGTAEKIPRAAKNYLVSFCGFAPYDNPEILLYVVIDTPHVEEQAKSSYATNVFHDMMAEILPYVNVFPAIGAETEAETVPPEQVTSETGGPEAGEESTTAEETTAPFAPGDDEITETLPGSEDFPESVIR